jgi:hypothetical protein
VHLHRDEREVLSERVAGRDEVRALLNREPPRGLVRLGNDNCEVARAQERRHARLDAIDALLKPLGRLREMRKVGRLFLEARGDVFERPCALAEMRAQRVAKVIVLGDVPERVHPALEAAVSHLSEAGDVVAADLAACRIALLALRAV